MDKHREALRKPFSDFPHKPTVAEAAWNQIFHGVKDIPGVDGSLLSFKIKNIWKDLVITAGGQEIEPDDARAFLLQHELANTFENAIGVATIIVLNMVNHYNLILSEITDGKLELLPSGLLNVDIYDDWMDSIQDKLPLHPRHDFRFRGQKIKNPPPPQEGYMSPELRLALLANDLFWSDYSSKDKSKRALSKDVTSWLLGKPVPGYPINPSPLNKSETEAAKRIDRLLRPPEVKAGGNIKQLPPKPPKNR